MIAIFIPTYNERENLQALVENISTVIKDSYRIIIVDDSSPDGTGELADELALKYPITVVHRKQRGRGSASIAGFKKALEIGADVVIEMDADHSHDPKYLPLFLNRMKDSDIVVGSRFIPGGGDADRDMFRTLLSSFSNGLTRKIMGLPLRDCTSGYKCYKKKVIETMDLEHIRSTEYSIGVEILYNAYKKGFTVTEVPIVFKNRVSGKSKLGIKIILLYLVVLFILRLRE